MLMISTYDVITITVKNQLVGVLPKLEFAEPTFLNRAHPNLFLVNHSDNPYLWTGLNSYTIFRTRFWYKFLSI